MLGLPECDAVVSSLSTAEKPEACPSSFEAVWCAEQFLIPAKTAMEGVCQGQCVFTPKFIIETVQSTFLEALVCRDAAMSFFIRLYSVIFQDTRGCGLSYSELGLANYGVVVDDLWMTGNWAQG